MDQDSNRQYDSLNIEIIENPSSLKNSRYKSLLQQILMGAVISMSAIMFGYGLSQISTINIDVLAAQYHITFHKPLAQGLLIGIMPVGGIFGAILNKFVLEHLHRRTSIFCIAVLMVVSIVLIEITTVYTLFLGRFIEGIGIGLYVSIGAIYLREIAAREVRSQVTALFSLGKVFGIVIAYSLQQILEKANYQYFWRILLGFNGIFAIFQALLIFLFIPESPIEMLQKGNQLEAKKSIIKMYKQQFVDEVFEQMKKDNQVSQIKRQSMSHQLKDSDIFKQKSLRAWVLAIHIIILRQFIGGNCLVTFAGQIVTVFSKPLGSYTPLLVNIIQLIANTFAVFLITKLFKRRPLFIFGTASLMVLNFVIAIVLFFQKQILILLFMSIYMALYGGSFLPISWSYPSEIMTADQSLVPNILGWIATAIVTSVPPIVVGVMPNHNAWPLFVFFGFYGVFGLVVLIWKMVESKNRTYEQIMKQF